MSSRQQINERRRSYRVAVDGTGFLWRRHELAGRYAIGDISIGGCLLQHGPPCDMQNDYRLVLHVGKHGAMRLPARIVRLHYGPGGGCDLGVTFTAHPPATEDRIHDLVMNNLEDSGGEPDGRVLVVHADPQPRRELGDAIRRLGYQVVEAASPLEAVWELENGPMDIHTAFVAGTLGKSKGQDVVKFLSARYPAVRRILVDAESPASEAADAVLEGPLSLSRLRKVMPREGTGQASGFRHSAG